MDYFVGQFLKIPCEVSKGPFAGEFLISIDTGLGAHSGFVRRESVDVLGEGRGLVTGEIVEVQDDTVVVRFNGSFFTTAAGVAQLSQTWVSSHASSL